jgi:hypothetical protein
MAEEPLRSLPHIYLPDHGQAQSYTAHQARGGASGELPARDRIAHADQLTEALTEAVRAGESLFAQRDSTLAGGTPGFYLEFEMPKSQAGSVEKLENQQGRFPIELLSVRPLIGEQETKIAATVFVPESRRDFYLKG